nr:hypothetical protein [Tanacetum cinerariifolium]
MRSGEIVGCGGCRGGRDGEGSGDGGGVEMMASVVMMSGSAPVGGVAMEGDIGDEGGVVEMEMKVVSWRWRCSAYPLKESRLGIRFVLTYRVTKKRF